MTKTFLAVLLLLGLQLKSVAQVGTGADEMILKIPLANTYTTAGITDYIKQHYTTDSARVRAIYVWITHNIAYDIERVKARTLNSNAAPQAVTDVLKERKAVCQGYAELFVALCSGVGIKAAMVGGYGKIGGAVSALSHAWVGAFVQGQWYLFDPTWGAGYVKDGRFVKAFNNSFYKVAPEVMIKDHMPFDPMYQFLHYPITNKEFVGGQTAVNTTKPLFNYADTLQQFALLSQDEKIKCEARRLTANGVVNDMIRERLMHLNKGVQVYAAKNATDEAGQVIKQGVDLLNQYITHKNKQFSTIEEQQLMPLLDSALTNIKNGRNLLFTIVAKDDSQRQWLAATHQNLEKMQQRLVEEKEFATRYLSSDKGTRMQLFGRR